MSLLIKINEPRNSETLELDHVRPGYIFRWEEKHRAYVYHPKNQAEIDSIFDAQRVYRRVWTFIPVLVDEVGPATKDPKETALLSSVQAELERVTANLTAATKRIEALKAEGDVLRAENTQIRADAVKLKAAADKAIADATAALTATPAPAPAKGKPGRPPRNTPPAPVPAPVPPASSGSADDAPPTE